MESNLFMGCDIAQDDFTYHLRDRNGLITEGTVKNSEKGITKWLKQLQKEHNLNLSRIIFCQEHTGIYGLILMRLLHERKLSLCVEHATNIKLSLGLQRGKNDKIDAARIAEYAMRYTDKLKLWRPRRDVVENLQLLTNSRFRLLKARKSLTKDIEDSKRFRTKPQTELLENAVLKSLAAIDEDLKQLDAEILKLIKSDENLNKLNRLITSVDNVGIVTSTAILVRSNEFIDYQDPKKFACTSGVAPYDHTSGKSIRGKSRVSHNAHKDIKTLLHMCAIGSIHRPGELKDYYDRKVGQGKNKMLVLNAVRNKLIHRIFAVVRTGVMYEKNYQYGLVMS